MEIKEKKKYRIETEDGTSALEIVICSIDRPADAVYVKAISKSHQGLHTGLVLSVLEAHPKIMEII
jgi:hypothetical protein